VQDIAIGAVLVIMYSLIKYDINGVLQEIEVILIMYKMQ
jgi:hypothetical protein